MDSDYDEWLSELIQEGLEQMLKKLTPEQLAELEDNAEEIASSAVAKAIDVTAKGMVETLKADAPAMLAHRRSGRTEFERRLAEHWGGAFDLSEMVMKVPTRLVSSSTRSTARQTGCTITSSRRWDAYRHEPAG